MKVYVTAVIISKPEFLLKVKSVLEDMVVKTRKETACIQYDLHQNLEDENVFVFYEIWQDKQGLDKHNEQPYIKDFGKIAVDKLNGNPVIYLMEKI